MIGTKILIGILCVLPLITGFVLWIIIKKPLSKIIKNVIAAMLVVGILLTIWFVIWVLPDVPVKSIRSYFTAIMNEDYETAWIYIYPKSDFQKEKGGPALSFDKFKTDLVKARSAGSKLLKFYIDEQLEIEDPFERAKVPAVRFHTDNLYLGTPKTSNQKDYYLKKNKDGIWKIYKGVTPKTQQQ